MPTEIEKRQHPRVDIRLPVVMLCHHEILAGETRNISLTGMFIRSYKPLNQDEDLRLAFEPPKLKPIWISGKVLWGDYEKVDGTTNEFFSGFSFLKISDADHDLLKKWMTGQMRLDLQNRFVMKHKMKRKKIIPIWSDVPMQRISSLRE